MKLNAKKVTIFALFTVVLTLVFFAIPGQFADLIPNSPLKADWTMGGFEFIFGGNANLRAIYGDFRSLVSGAGIAFLVILALAIAAYCTQKFSSSLLLLAGVFMLTDAIMLFCAKGWVTKIYPEYASSTVGLWVPYLCASLLMIAALVTIYTAIKLLASEVKMPVSDKKESYSYLKNK